MCGMFARLVLLYQGKVGVSRLWVLLCGFGDAGGEAVVAEFAAVADRGVLGAGKF